MRHHINPLRGQAVVLALGLVLAAPALARADADPVKGVRTFANVCGPCHAVAPGRHMTGPSLADIVGRKAGSLEGFDRYSKAIKDSGVAWNGDTLAAWLLNPQAVIPGTSMPPVAADDPARADIIAYLLATQTPGAPPRDDIPKPYQKSIDLKAAGPATRIAAITLCRDTYTVRLENGSALLFWEPNIRFKTDQSAEGPAVGKPVLVPTGMHGDRTYAVFATPQEISSFVRAECLKP